MNDTKQTLMVILMWLWCVLTNRDMFPMTRQITGKAMMLDEIINYVQSLQRQVEVSVLKTYDLEVYSMVSLGQWLNLHFHVCVGLFSSFR